MVTDIIADLLTRVRNAQLVGHRVVKVQSSRVSKLFLDVLKAEGFISGYKAVTPEGEKFEFIEVALKYYGSGRPVIRSAQRVSRSGNRVYRKSTELPRVFSSLGISVLSTSKGIMSDREARKQRVGGEVMAIIG